MDFWKTGAFICFISVPPELDTQQTFNKYLLNRCCNHVLGKVSPKFQMLVFMYFSIFCNLFQNASSSCFLHISTRQKDFFLDHMLCLGKHSYYKTLEVLDMLHQITQTQTHTHTHIHTLNMACLIL